MTLRRYAHTLRPGDHVMAFYFADNRPTWLPAVVRRVDRVGSISPEVVVSLCSRPDRELRLMAQPGRRSRARGATDPGVATAARDGGPMTAPTSVRPARGDVLVLAWEDGSQNVVVCLDDPAISGLVSVDGLALVVVLAPDAERGDRYYVSPDQLRSLRDDEAPPAEALLALDW